MFNALFRFWRKFLRLMSWNLKFFVCQRTKPPIMPRAMLEKVASRLFQFSNSFVSFHFK